MATEGESANPVAETFAALAARGEKALCPYLTGGFPDVHAFRHVLRAVGTSGAGLIEVGMPYSDPVADGPVICASFQHVLAQHLGQEAILQAITETLPDLSVPVVGMTSYSLVYRKGVAAYVKRVAEAGLAGLIVPDLPVEESRELIDALRESGLAFIPMVAPTTEAERRLAIAREATGFVYYQSSLGITGERERLPEQLARDVRELSGAVGKPICVGFGIHTPEQVRQVVSVADGAIVGSALVRCIARAHEGRKDPAAAAAELVSYLAEGLRA